MILLNQVKLLYEGYNAKKSILNGTISNDSKYSNDNLTLTLNFLKNYL